MIYESSNQPKQEPENSGVHPIWRAVGCLLILIIPIIGFTGSFLLIQLNRQNHWMTIPQDFINAGGDPYLYIKIGLTVLISLVLYILFMLVTFLMNSALGPKKYGPTDVPQQRYKGKNYKR